MARKKTKNITKDGFVFGEDGKIEIPELNSIQMEGSYSYIVNNINKEDIEGLSKLKLVLNKTGGDVKLKYVEEAGLYYINFNIGTMFPNPRGAGRKKKKTNLDVSELISRIDKGMTNKEIMEEFGIPHATFYRAIKTIKGLREEFNNDEAFLKEFGFIDIGRIDYYLV